MKLLFNATMIRSEGGVSLLLHYLEHFLEEQPDLHILLYLNPDLYTRVHVKFNEEKRLEIISFQPKGFLQRFWWEQVTLPRLLKKQQVDCLFSYGNTGPLFPGCYQILYVHQAIPYTQYKPHLHCLQWFTLVWLFRLVIGIAQLGSKKIVVQTHWLVRPLRRSMLNLIPLPRYVVSMPGIPQSNIEPGILNPAEVQWLEIIKSAKAAGQRILFYPTFLAPYKHIPYLFQAISHLKTITSIPFKLILTFDPTSREYFPCKLEILACLNHLQVDQEVLLIGALSRTAIDKVYDETDLLLFPSRTESLGMPLLEAMNKGISVVALQQSENFAEDVCGNAAFYANPDNPDNFAQQIKRLLEDESLLQTQKLNALQRVQTFSWARHIRDILHEDISGRIQ